MTERHGGPEPPDLLAATQPSEMPEGPFVRPPANSLDIDVVPPPGHYPLSRGARERKLERKDRYDRKAEVTAYETLTGTGTVRISFRVVDDEPFHFYPGYFVGIRANVSHVGVCKSPYCIVSAPNEDRTFQLLVRLVPTGPLSYYLGGLHLGDVISFRGPSGRSMAPKEPASQLVLLATGVGIGPFLALVEYLVEHGFDRPIRIFWGLRLSEDICLVDELNELSRRYDDLDWQVSLSRPPAGWTGLRGRITESVPPLLETLGNKHFYLVGNGRMCEEMSGALSDLGVDERLVYQEVYFNSKYCPDPQSQAQLRARFVAHDLFSPFMHREANLFLPDRPVSGARGERLNK